MRRGLGTRGISRLAIPRRIPSSIKGQIKAAKKMGITAFVVDWYGDREPFIDRSYAEMQKQAGKNNFQVAMMYDETNQEDDATDEAIADFTMFHDTYLVFESGGPPGLPDVRRASGDLHLPERRPY